MIRVFLAESARAATLGVWASASLVALATAACSSDAASRSPATDAGTDANDAALACPASTGTVVHDRERITTSTTWRAAVGVHVIRGSMRVTDGATLTLEPCAIVALEADAVLEIGDTTSTGAARLVAEGDAARPIVFRRSGNDAWGYVSVQYPGTASFAYATLEGGGSEYPNGHHSMLMVRGTTDAPAVAAVSLKHVTLRNAVGPALWVREQATFTADSTDITVSGSGLATAKDLEQFPVVVTSSALTALPPGDYQGNAVKEILIDTDDVPQGGVGSLENTRVHDRGVPYRVGEWAGAEWRFDTESRGGMSPVLTIEAGVTLRFAQRDSAHSGGKLAIHHSTTSTLPGEVLRVEGTAAKPVTFTSSAAAPAPGDWIGLWFGSGVNSATSIDHAIIEYAGAESGTGGFTCPDSNKNDGAIQIIGGPASRAFITNTAIRHTLGNGITRGWDVSQGPSVDFAATNAITDVEECTQSIVRPVAGSCPSTCN